MNTHKYSQKVHHKRTQLKALQYSAVSIVLRKTVLKLWSFDVLFLQNSTKLQANYCNWSCNSWVYNPPITCSHQHFMLFGAETGQNRSASFRLLYKFERSNFHQEPTSFQEPKHPRAASTFIVVLVQLKNQVKNFRQIRKIWTLILYKSEKDK